MFKPTAVLVLVPSVLAAAEPPKAHLLATEAEARALVERSMTLFVRENYKAGFDLLKPYWKMPDSEVDTLILQTMAQRATVKPRYGKAIGYEFICSKAIGASFLRLTYVEKLENTALRYNFFFYRPSATWEIASVFWDDKINLLFGE